MINLLKGNKNFRLFWEASCISAIGDYFDDIAFAMLIFAVTKSTLWTSYVFAIKMILSFVSMFTSTVVDYGNKKKILIITSFGQGFLLCILFVLYQIGYTPKILLMCFVTIQTIFSTFSSPAQNSLLPLLISNEEALVARASNSMIQQFIQIFSYIGSGVVISIIGISGAILIDIISFFIAGCILLRMSYPDFKNQNVVKDDFIENAKDGFKYILSSKLIVGILFVTFLGNLFATPIDSLSVAYFGLYHTKSYTYPIFMTSIAFGGILGTWVLTKIKDIFTMNSLLAQGFAFGGIGIALLYNTNNLLIVVLSGFLYGISNGFVSTMNGVLLQVNTPREMMGRVFSAFRCVSFASGPIGILLVGFFAETLELNYLFSALGLLLIATAIISHKCTDPSSVNENDMVCHRNMDLNS